MSRALAAPPALAATAPAPSAGLPAVCPGLPARRSGPHTDTGGERACERAAAAEQGAS